MDAIHNGISQNRKIRFQYYEYTVQKTRRYRKHGKPYIVSPFALTWDNENYYLIAYDSSDYCIKHYRVDKMSGIQTTDEARDGLEEFKEIDLARYSSKVFGMFAGETVQVKLRFRNHLVGAVLDRLGQDVTIIPDGFDHFTVTADVVPSPQFFAWIVGFGTDVKLLAPAKVVEQLSAYINSVAALYH